MQNKINFCECGCRKLCKRHFVNGHNRKGTIHIVTDKTKNLLRQANLEKHQTEDTKKKIRIALLGNKNSLERVCSEDTKEKLRKANSGENNGFYGKHHTKETGDKIRKSNSTRAVTAQTREKHRQLALGRSHVITGATKEKMRQAHLGKPGPMLGKKHNAETIEKLRISHMGHVPSSETVEKIMKSKSGHKKFLYMSENGIAFHMRSNWEVSYAKYLDSLNIIWQYESKGFMLSNGHRYFPDFYLVISNEYHEVKGYLDTAAKEKMELFQKEYPNIHFTLIEEKEMRNLRIV